MNRIVQDIISFLAEAWIVPQTMFEKILLPDDPMVAVIPSFPVTDDLRISNLIAEAEKKMHMIWHEQSEMAMPALIVMVRGHGLENKLA